MKTYLLVFTLLLFSDGYSQRWFAINDSTSYSYQGIDITVGRNKVYRNQNNTFTLIRDFSTNNTEIPEDYIRDFDFIDQDTWYVLVGSRYIGVETELYKTDDAGATWQLIVPESFTVTSFLNGQAKNINQIQVLHGRIYLFDAYYESRVFYSDDLGQTWVLWFQNQMAHFYQILTCGSNLYIYGLDGDGFFSSMTKIPDTVFGQTNATFDDGCYNTSTAGCYFATIQGNATSVPEICNYYNNLIPSICALNNQEFELSKVKITPNPTQSNISICGINTANPFEIKIYDVLGKLLYDNQNSTEIATEHWDAGVYLLSIQQGGSTKTITLIKK